jgi:hypothetical protein
MFLLVPAASPEALIRRIVRHGSESLEAGKFNGAAGVCLGLAVA